MRYVAQQIGCTPAEVEDVVSYYTMFYTKPVGKYVLNVCRTLSCALLGAERVTEELEREARASSRARPTPTATFTLIEVECLGACDRAPVVMVNDDWHERLAPEQAAQFIDDLKARGPAAFTGCHLHSGEEGRRQAARQRHGLRTCSHLVRPRAERVHARLLPPAARAATKGCARR